MKNQYDAFSFTEHVLSGNFKIWVGYSSILESRKIREKIPL